MSEFEKIECSCADAYTARKLRDPNCCAHSCDYNELVDRIAEIEREKAELVSQVENLKSAMSNAVNVTDLSASVEQAQAVYRMESAINATPAQCLNQIKAEAVRQFASHASKSCASGWIESEYEAYTAEGNLK